MRCAPRTSPYCGVGDDLGKAVVVAERQRFARSLEGERADLHLVSLLARLRRGEAEAGDLRMGYTPAWAC